MKNIKKIILEQLTPVTRGSKLSPVDFEKNKVKVENEYNEQITRGSKLSSSDFEKNKIKSGGEYNEQQTRGGSPAPAPSPAPSPAPATNAFPTCITRILNIQISGNVAKVTQDGVTVTFNSDKTYSATNGSSGKWECYGNDITYSSTQTNTNTNSGQAGGGEWIDKFPTCVRGLKQYYNPPNNYVIGFGSDKSGVQYVISYFNQKEAKGYVCRIYSSDGKTDLGNGYYKCGNNDQQIIITDITGKVIIGSVVFGGSIDAQSSSSQTTGGESGGQKDQATMLKDRFEKYNIGGLELLDEDGNLDENALNRGTDVVEYYITQDKARSYFFRVYLSMLKALSDYLKVTNKPEQQTIVDENRTILKEIGDKAKNEFAQKGNTEWDAWSNPLAERMSMYDQKDITASFPAANSQIVAYVLRGEGGSRKDLEQNITSLDSFLQSTEVTGKWCKSTLRTAANCANLRQEDPGLFSKLFKGDDTDEMTVGSCSGYDTRKKQEIKQKLVDCSNSGVFDKDKTLQNVYNRLASPSQQRFRIEPNSTDASQQPDDAQPKK